MSAQHTPGPWHVVPEKDGIDVMAGRYYIAETFEFAGDESDDTTQYANARLIAAAPDLLDAVREFLDMTEEPPEPNCSCHVSPPCCDCVHHAGLRGAFKVARAAVAKATGAA